MRAWSVRMGLAWLLCVAAAEARAQTGGNLSLNRFRAAMDSRGYVTVDASQILGHKEISFGLVTSWGHRVLELEGSWSGKSMYAGTRASYTVENVITPELVAAIGLFRIIELGVSIPFAIVSGDIGPDYHGQGDDPQDDESFAFSAQGVGDIGLHAKLRILNTSRHAVGLAVIGSVYVPGGYDERAWLGDGALTLRPMLVIDKELARGRLRLAGNVGIKLRTARGDRFVDGASNVMESPGQAEAPYTGAAVAAGDELPWGAGVAYALAPEKLDLVAELIGSIPLGGENYLPLEAVGGIKVYLARSSFLTLGGGAGLLPGAAGGNPDLRAFVGIVFEPNVGDKDADGIKDDLDACPLEPEDLDDFRDSDGCPEVDNDLDGLRDGVDRCPNEPEDKDGVEDDDGCPDGGDLDRDSDGIHDAIDRCPDDPEDRDDFQDDDGCPDPDNDRDGILDLDDVCINDPEDRDDFEDENGCPDPDDDKDRILDAVDRCRLEPEDHDGIEDDDGCPERGGVTLGTSTIELYDKVYFETDKAVIKPESHAILDAVAATLQANPAVLLVEIQGHADERGDDAHNDALTEARAHAVLEYLHGKGVARDRMRAKGYGERVPLDNAHTEDAWSKNRRVEFIIVERAKEP